MKRVLPQDWLGVGLHGGIAAVATAVVTILGFPFFALFANSVGWPIREAFQGGIPGLWPWQWSVQKHWEAWAPVLIGWLIIAEVMARG